MDISEEEGERLKQPEGVSGPASVSLSCSEFSVMDGNERTGKERGRNVEDLQERFSCYRIKGHAASVEIPRKSKTNI